jgi:hypothetical protein
VGPSHLPAATTSNYGHDRVRVSQKLTCNSVPDGVGNVQLLLVGCRLCSHIQRLRAGRPGGVEVGADRWLLNRGFKVDDTRITPGPIEAGCSRVVCCSGVQLPTFSSGPPGMRLARASVSGRPTMQGKLRGKPSAAKPHFTKPVPLSQTCKQHGRAARLGWAQLEPAVGGGGRGSWQPAPSYPLVWASITHHDLVAFYRHSSGAPPAARRSCGLCRDGEPCNRTLIEGQHSAVCRGRRSSSAKRPHQLQASAVTAHAADTPSSPATFPKFIADEAWLHSISLQTTADCGSGANSRAQCMAADHIVWQGASAAGAALPSLHRRLHCCFHSTNSALAASQLYHLPSLLL